MNSTKNRRQNGRQGGNGFKFHNFVFNEGKQSFCLEEQDGNKKITVMHWKKTEQSTNEDGTSSHSEETFSETTSCNYSKSADKPNTHNINNKNAVSSSDAQPEQTQPLDLSTKTTRRREMWSVDEILGLDTPTSSSRHLELPSPSAMMASMSCRSPDVRANPYTSFFPANPFHYGTPPPSPMIDAMFEDEIQRFLRANGDVFSDQNNNFDTNIEEKMHSLRKELQERRLSSKTDSNDILRSHFKLKDSGFGPFSESRDSATNRRTMSELDLKASAKSNKQLKRSYDDNSTASMLFNNTTDSMTTKLRQLRKFTRNYLDAHKSAAEAVWPPSSSSPTPATLHDKEDSRDMQIECDEQIKKIWPGITSSTPLTSASSSSTVQSSASASSVDGGL